MKLIDISISRPFNLAFIVFSLAGFLDAAYLTTKHFQGQAVVCNFTSGCNDVLTSQYSEIFGLPTALYGALYYLLILVSALVYWQIKNKLANMILIYFTVVGFIFSLYLVYLQLFIIKSICVYCMGSAATSTILFLLSLYVIIRFKNTKPQSYE